MFKKERTICTKANSSPRDYIAEISLCLTWAYIILIPLFVLANSAVRGYFAIGGEAFGWIIPLIVYMECNDE